MLYLIAYDLHNGTEQEYEILHAAIKDMVEPSSYFHIQQSIWVIASYSHHNCQALFDELSAKVSKNAKILVAKLSEVSYKPAINDLSILIGLQSEY